MRNIRLVKTAFAAICIGLLVGCSTEPSEGDIEIAIQKYNVDTSMGKQRMQVIDKFRLFQDKGAWTVGSQ